MSRSVLVTGAAGFVGVNVVRRLRELGWTIRTVDVRPLAGVETDGIDHVVADVRDREAMERACRGVEVVIHLAARITLATEDREAWDINVSGPATVADAALAAGVGRFVHCSSVHAYDLSLAIPRLDELSPRSIAADRPLYDRSKWAGETEVRSVIARGLDATIVNPTGILGPVDLGPSRINQIIDSAARGRLPVVVRGGFDWVDVRDVAEATIVAVDAGATGENYLIGGHQATALHLGRLAAALNGHLGPVVALPATVAGWAAPLGERIGRRFGNDSFTPASIGTLVDHPEVVHDRATEVLGHRPRPLEDSVRDTVRWFEGDPRL